MSINTEKALVKTLEETLEQFTKFVNTSTAIIKQLLTENERMGIVLLEIRNGEWDEECETKERLKEAYTYVPRSLIDRAFASGKPKGE